MVGAAAALRFDANVRDAGILRGEVFRQHHQFGSGFERRLATRRLAEDSAVGPLTIEREARAVALSANELEAAVSIRTLRNVGVEIEKLVDVATISRYIEQLPVV